MGTRAPQPAGTAEPVPVAFIGRTSTLGLQDPRASLRRQIRSAQAWLPAGWYIAGYYWDIESGGIDLEDRSQGEGWKQIAGQDIPRDGGMADLLAAAASPDPGFVAVVCEDIERSGRDTFNALKLEKELSRHGIILFATDEPADIAGVNSTAILVRRVKQGVAEWFRLQLKEKAWKGFVEHALDGWNVGTPPHGYIADRVTHPNPAKAAQGRTKTRLALGDPDTGAAITRAFEWRVTERLAVATIVTRLNKQCPALAPDGFAWTYPGVASILANPKYTGHMVYGRTRNTGGPGQRKIRPVPPEQWLWTPEPVHPALITRQTWEEAQTIGAGRGNIRDTETETRQPGRRYTLRSRIRHAGCKHRMHGTTLNTRKPDGRSYSYIYYKCPHNPADPHHAALNPDHGRVAIRETTLDDALRRFLEERVFGPDRAAMLADQLPATDAEAAEHAETRATALRQQITRTETAEQALMTELETLGTDTSPATTAYRARIRERFTQLYDQRTQAQNGLAELTAAAPDTPDPTLLDELPDALALLSEAPAHVREHLYDALDIQVLYRHEKQQATIWATLTDATPDAIRQLLTDPRTDNDATTDGYPDPFRKSGELTTAPIVTLPTDT